MKIIDIEKMNRLFHYDNGKLICKIDRGPINNRVYAGDIAGNLSASGYWSVKVNGKRYLSHRIIYAMHYGEIPVGCYIDHINGVSDDNRIENLRLATPLENIRNQKTHQKDNQLGVQGVGVDKRGLAKNYPNPYRARIRVNTVLKSLGFFKTPELASEAYQAARIKYFGEFA